MGFFSKDFGSPILYNWMDATAHEQSVKPIRGRSPECKPIGKRTKTQATIRKLDNESIACRLYHTDVVTYHKDGTIEINLDGYATQSTIAFIEEILGVRACIRHNYAWINANLPGEDLGGWYALSAGWENNFKRNGQGDLEFQNSIRVLRHKINRVGANNVRKQFKAFKTYIVQTMRLRDDGFSAQEFGDIFGWVKPDLPDYPTQFMHRRKFLNMSHESFKQFIALAQSTKVQDQYKASLWLVRSAGYTNGNGKWRTTEKDMLTVLDDLILYAHRDECFEVVLDKESQNDIVRDSYGRFFD